MDHQFRRSIAPRDLISRLVLAWLTAVFFSYAALPMGFKSLAGLCSVSEVSLPLMAAIGAAVFLALNLIGLRRNLAHVERCLIFGFGSAAFVLSAVFNPMPAYLVGVACVVAIFWFYARKGWDGSEPLPLPAEPAKHNWKRDTAIAAALSFLFLSIWGLARIWSLVSPTYDFGIFAQMFERMRQTGLPVTTLERDGLLSHFAVHVSPAYYLLLPFYLIYPHPETLNVLQAALIVLSVIPLWLLAAHFGYAPKYRFLLCVIFLLFPFLLGGNNYDLHENAFLTVFLLCLFCAGERGSVPLSLLFAMLTLSVKEDAAVYVAVYGLYLIAHALLHPEQGRKRLLIGLCIAVIAVGWFLGVTSMLRNRGDGVMTNRYENMMFNGKDSLVYVIICVLISPMKAIYECLDVEKLEMFFHALPMLLMIPALTRKYERFLLLIPLFLLNLLSDYPYQHSIYFQYSFGSSAFLILLYVMNLRDLLPRLRPAAQKWPLLANLAICAVSFCICIAPKCTAVAARAIRYQAEISIIREKLSQVPKDTVVTSSQSLTVPMYDYPVIYDWEYSTDEHLLQSEYVVVQMGSLFRPLTIKRALADNWKGLIKKLEANGYTLVDEYESCLRIYRRPPSNP